MKAIQRITPFLIVALFSIFGFSGAYTNLPDVFADKIDSSVDPAKDFFLYANGKWFKNNPIPSSETNWGVGDLVQEEIYKNLKSINENSASHTSDGTRETQQIGNFWSAGMDSANCEQKGITPLNDYLAIIDGAKDLPGVVNAMNKLECMQIGIFHSGISVGQDSKNSERMVVNLYQGGLGLPDRDYYFNTDADTKKIRAAYVKHIANVLALSGTNVKIAQKMSKKIVAFETSLATNSRKLAQLRDPYANYNMMGIDDVTKKLTPSIDWKAACTAQGLKNVDSIMVGQPEFFSQLEKLMKGTNVEVMKYYMRYHLVSAYASFLNKALDDEDFNFFGKILSGAQSQRPRWKRVLDAEEGAMGMVLGKLFVQEYFPEKTKKRYNDMVEAIRTAYAERIKRLDWMSDATKTKALDKLSRMTKKVGYPDKWKDYSKLVIGRNSYGENMINSALWHYNDMISKYGKPVDRTEWDMTPQTYNAYYNPSNNEIVLPAAIFTIPGYPDSLIDDAVVYGYGAASTIGHEMTHGFDDEGRNFDAAGNLVSWWTDEDAKKFQERSAVMVRQFNAYEPLPGKHINGAASLGENIADYGGVLLGIDAFKKTQQYKEGKLIGGYTPMQRYFLGYALGWMIEQRDQELAKRLMTDVHAPAKWRVIGPFSNVPEFYDAFHVKPGDPMWRADSVRVSIW
ncbi:MAG: M13 family metallopeptidase [Bacteroidetes bacterium]|nr:M13 family metallopeptidase [Bacteroidota bacterium]